MARNRSDQTRRRAAALQLNAVLAGVDNGASGDLWQMISHAELDTKRAPFPTILRKD